jgi:predicted tellurium resistance membrane protein TerC
VILVAYVALLNLVLSSDNTLMIAVLGRALHHTIRRGVLAWSFGISLGLQFALVLLVSILFKWTVIQSLFGLLILYMAFQLLSKRTEEAKTISLRQFWPGVMKVVLGNMMMSFENAAALIGASHGNPWIAWLGIAVSSPLVFFGSGLLASLLERYSFLLYLGSILLIRIGSKLFFSWSALKFLEPVTSWLVTAALASLVVWMYIRSYPVRTEPLFARLTRLNGKRRS